MFSSDDTIVALATPPGRGAIAVVRLSGPLVTAIAGAIAGRPLRLRPRRMTRVRLAGLAVDDDALLTYFEGPASYTGEDVLEVCVHGSPVVAAAVVAGAIEHGARAADPGEFTLRGFVHGKFDLLQAEAVQEVVDAVSPAHARAAIDHLTGGLSAPIAAVADDLRALQTMLEASIDFPDEGYKFLDTSALVATLQTVTERIAQLVESGARGHIVRDGLRVVLVGAPNVGKSSVFNALVGAERAIVTAVPGTTRDLVSARVVVHGRALEVVDTAGARATVDVVEAEGVRRGIEAARGADVVVVVLDRSQPLTDEDGRVLSTFAHDTSTLVVANKCDLPAAWAIGDVTESALAVSARTGEGLTQLATALSARATPGASTAAEPLVTNARHLRLLRAAGEHVAQALESASAATGPAAEEFVAADVQLALASLEELVGTRTSEEILHEIFARFCIGK